MGVIEQSRTVEINRSEINIAGYNPRRITPEAKQKLRTNLQKMGVMGGLVWNRQTGNLVSGHQRLSILDEDNLYDKKTKANDYKVFVTEVNLSEKDEKTQNIFFNNQTAMGYFDEDKLHEIMKGVDFSEMTGFSKQNQIQMFQETDLTDEEYAEIAENVEEFTERNRAIKENASSESDANYVVLVFKNRNDKENLVTNMGVELDDGRFVNGCTFLEQMYENFKHSRDEE